jgi:dipeptidyl aminopeptidase/acylaminoacyl peptidase
MKRRRWLTVLVIAVPVLALVAYFGASWYVYDQLSASEAGCSNEGVADPTAYTIEGVDTTPYLLPPPENVRFASRGDPGIEIAGWWFVSARRADAPAVILVHGKSACRQNPDNVLVAGMLYGAGFSVLSIDVRDTGDSTIEDNRFAGGQDENRDVLGAVDFLAGLATPPEQFGVLGFSLGAASATIAFGEEPKIGALWSDSGFADISEAIRDELTRNGYPTFLDVGAVLVGRVIAGDDLTAYNPVEEIAKANGRAVFIVHGANDERLSPRYAGELAAAVREAGGSVEPWIVPGAGHTEAPTVVPDEYAARLAAFFGGALGTP